MKMIEKFIQSLIECPFIDFDYTWLMSQKNVFWLLTKDKEKLVLRVEEYHGKLKIQTGFYEGDKKLFIDINDAQEACNLSIQIILVANENKDRLKNA